MLYENPKYHVALYILISGAEAGDPGVAMAKAVMSLVGNGEP